MLSHTNYVSSSQLIIDQLASHIEPRSRPHIGPRAVLAWTTQVYNNSIIYRAPSESLFNWTDCYTVGAQLKPGEANMSTGVSIIF